jgi:hypothetical protein
MNAQFKTIMYSKVTRELDSKFQIGTVYRVQLATINEIACMNVTPP